MPESMTPTITPLPAFLAPPSFFHNPPGRPSSSGSEPPIPAAAGASCDCVTYRIRSCVTRLTPGCLRTASACSPVICAAKPASVIR